VDGFLDAIHFQEGRFVDQGDLLYSIDPRPFETKVMEAKGGLAEANTALAKTRSDLDRIRPLAEMNAVSAQDLDAAVAQYEAAQSSVQIAEAQVELAEIELGYTQVYAPVDGLIGLTKAEVGDFVGQGATGGVLNIISRTDPIGVRLSVAERAYLLAARRLAGTDLDSIDRVPNLHLILADGSEYPHLGRATKIDRNINASTGTLTVEAEFPNPDQLLRPGMFARVRFDAETREGALLVPQRAVTELQSSFRVFVIGADNTVEVRQVEVGPRLGSEWIIESGLNTGDRVAVEGLLRMRPGMAVNPVPFVSDGA
jgi:membrane fusion protein (multidrug efflux system)